MPGHEFGRYLRRERTVSRLSLRSLAKRLGMSHVFLSDVERGLRPPFNEKWWPKLVKNLRGVTLEALEEKASRSRPIRLDIRGLPPRYQDLALALATRVRHESLTPSDFRKLFRILDIPSP